MSVGQRCIDARSLHDQIRQEKLDTRHGPSNQPTVGGGFRVGFDSNSKDVLVLKLMCVFFCKDDAMDVMAAIMGPAEKDDEGLFEQ